MRLLLDTHVAVWSVSSSRRLPPSIVEMIADPDNEILVSVVSLWEIALKTKSSAGDPMPFGAESGNNRFSEFGYTQLALLPTHIFRFETLKPLHSDPFDRLLISQALVEQARIVTHDSRMSLYGHDTVLGF